ncbi:MAG: glycerol kinase [Clostridiales bacterium]|nr:glycerol kinase [Clostridiales bacterium]
MEEYIVSIDQSTSASKVFLIDSTGKILRRYSKKHSQYYPQTGWSEHDADEIFQNVTEGIKCVSDGIPAARIAAISISNQRETTAFFERESGTPVRKAIVWQDVRAKKLCEGLASSAGTVKTLTGLDLSPYYSAAKASHALSEDETLRRRAENGEICISTIDSYLVYRLTGGKCFATDASNASRTQLFNLQTLGFDKELCDIFSVPYVCLPEVRLSDELFGVTACEGIPSGIRICGVMGDSHASLFGQGCFSEGQVKTSYGTGSSVMLNTGEKICVSPRGLSTSVAFGRKGKVLYSLEGNITHSGDTISWLCSEAGLAETPDEAEKLARSVDDCGGVFLVPAFSGMGAPYFDENAKAAFIGMNRGTTRAHLVRAAVESMAYQNADVLEYMSNAYGKSLNKLCADGGGSRNTMLMQLQADLCGCEVAVSDETELSALGCALMAGDSLDVFDLKELAWHTVKTYFPNLSSEDRHEKMKQWRNAVSRILTV